MNNTNNDNIKYETILVEREKIIRYLRLPEDIDSLELNQQMYIIYTKGKVFLKYVNDNDLKIGDSTLIPQIDFNKNICIENALTIYKNTYTFAQNTCRYLDIDLYGAAINLLVEVFNRITKLIEDNNDIDLENIELSLINDAKENNIYFYITSGDLLIDSADIENDKMIENMYTKRNEIYDLYKKQTNKYSILSDLEGSDVINANFGLVDVIIKKEEDNKEQFEKIVNEIKTV